MLRLTNRIQEARVPRPPLLRWGAFHYDDGNGWGNGANFLFDNVLPGGVPPSATRICIGAISLRNPNNWGFGSATFKINGVAADWSLARRTGADAVVLMAGLLDSGREGDNVEFSVTGATGNATDTGSRALLLDSQDLVTTWPTPAASGSDIGVSPSVSLSSILAGAISISVGQITSDNSNSVSNMTMIDVGQQVGASYYHLGYRISAVDESITPTNDNGISGAQVLAAVSLNPTLDKFYL